MPRILNTLIFPLKDIRMTSYCDDAFLRLVGLCPGVPVSDLMRVECLLTRDTAVPTVSRANHEHLSDAFTQLQISNMSENSSIAERRDTVRDINECIPTTPYVSRCLVPSPGLLEESRLEDYVYYDLDICREVQCGPLFGGKSSAKSSTPLSAHQIKNNFRNDTTDSSVEPTVTRSNKWKLDISLRSASEDRKLSNGDDAEEGSKRHSENIRLTYKNVSFFVIPPQDWAKSIKRSIEEAFGSIEQSRIMPKNVCSDNNSGGVLMITSKANIEQWERCARNYYSSSFHSYTAPLSQRRKFGATRLSTFDIVMSTLGVLTAKECSIPAFMLSDDAGYDSNEDLDKNDDGSRNSDCDIGGENWLRRRRCSNLTMDASYLHLLRWKKIIIEVDEKVRLKPNAVKTDALLKLRGDAIEYHYVNAEDENQAIGTTYSTESSCGLADYSRTIGEGDVKTLKIFQDISDMYNIPSNYRS